MTIEDSIQSEFFPLANAIDHEILMHRDAHFGGKFEVMIDYYRKEGKGIHPDFDLERISELLLIERELRQNLAGLLLTGSEAEKVAEAKTVYKKLRELYEQKDVKNKGPLLIADLILSEEEQPDKEIEAIVAEKAVTTPLLINLLRSENFYDPLFPGYGQAPLLAAYCLGEIGDKKAIISLFEAIDQSDFEHEGMVLKALHNIGEPAKEFLLKVLHGKPYNQDNEKAALALIQFKDDPKVIQACLDMLKDPEVLKDIPLSTYLVLACEDIQEEAQKAELKKISEDSKLSKMLKKDIEAILRG
jgi:HEAT repeat protein